jgi:hypothetical protein
MCYEPYRRKFDLWYEIMCNLDVTYTKWLEKEKKKEALFYDGSHRDYNMATNHLESFNHVLKNTHAMLISTLVQLTFYICNGY